MDHLYKGMYAHTIWTSPMFRVLSWVRVQTIVAEAQMTTILGFNYTPKEIQELSIS